MFVFLFLVFGFCNAEPQETNEAHNCHMRSGTADAAAQLTSEDEAIVISDAIQPFFARQLDCHPSRRGCYFRALFNQFDLVAPMRRVVFEHRSI
jgi:hypothetical protein